MNKVTEGTNITVHGKTKATLCVWTLKFKIREFGKMMLGRQALALLC